MKKSSVLAIALMMLTFPAVAQLCSGSLGDPVAAFRFGTGTTNGPALPSAITNYAYSASSCPNDGYYTITGSSQNCFNNSWHSLLEDHTPNDANGRYMLVNASIAPGIFYLDTVRGLCGGTTYEFSAYMANLLRPSSCGGNGTDPNLTFTIENTDGTVLTTYNTGNIAETNTASWQQYGTFFQTPSNVDAVVLRIRNNAPGGCGNDIAIDDITFRPCGPLVSTTIPSLSTDNLVLCIDDNRSFLLEGIYSDGYADPRTQWQRSTDNGQTWEDIPGATANTYLRTPTGIGNYQYRMLVADGINIGNAVCRIASSPVSIRVTPLPTTSLPPMVAACSGNGVFLNSGAIGTHTWTGPGGFSATGNPLVLSNVQLSQAGAYYLVMVNSDGCTQRDTSMIQVLQSVSLTLTPNQGICEGRSVTLDANGGTSYAWTPSTGLSDPSIANPIARPTDSIRYQVIANNAANCPDTGFVEVAVWQNPTANAGPDLWTINNQPVTIQGSVTGSNTTIFWRPTTGLSDPQSPTPTVTLTANGFVQDFTFRMEVLSGLGCGTARDEVTIKVFESLKVPNTFTPNGDGVNDSWELRLLQVFPNASVEVYNTAGQLVFRSMGYARPWDGKMNGKDLPAGTYYYVIDPKSRNFNKLTGYVTLIR